MILAGAIFVAGALGMESLGGYLQDNQFSRRVLSLEVFLEETCEIIGVLLFVLALMKLLIMRCKSISAIL